MCWAWKRHPRPLAYLLQNKGFGTKKLNILVGYVFYEKFVRTGELYE